MRITFDTKLKTALSTIQILRQLAVNEKSKTLTFKNL